MGTQAGEILDAAIASSLLFDDAETAVAEDATELLKVLNRILTSIYTLAGRPPFAGGRAFGEALGVTADVTLTVTGVSIAITPAIASLYLITDANGVEVVVVPRIDVVRGLAELGPAVVIEGRLLTSAGRVGDPVTDDVLTLWYTPIPGPLSVAEHYIGATSPGDDSTTLWPEIGNPFLIAALIAYLLGKTEEADPAMMQRNQAELARAAQDLGEYLRLDGTRLLALTKAT